MTHSIELDCAPGFPRPSAYIMSVVKGTCLETITDPENPTSKFFGNWMWTYPNISNETWKEMEGLLKFRIVRLYQKGKIRYGSW